MRSIRQWPAPLYKPQAASNTLSLGTHPGKSPKFSDAFCYPCARCRCFSSLYTVTEDKDSREKQGPDPKWSSTRLQTPLLRSSAKWDFPNYQSSLPNRRLIPENLPQIWFYFMECAIVILLPKWRFVFAGNVLSVTHIAVIGWLSRPLTATKLRKPYIQVINITDWLQSDIAESIRKASEKPSVSDICTHWGPLRKTGLEKVSRED